MQRNRLRQKIWLCFLVMCMLFSVIPMGIMSTEQAVARAEQQANELVDEYDDEQSEDEEEEYEEFEEIFGELVDEPFSAFNAMNTSGAQDLEVRLGSGALIGNLSHDAENAVASFYTEEAGFKLDKIGDLDFFADGTVRLVKGQKATFTIRVADNPLLKELASSGHAIVEFGWRNLVWTEKSSGPFGVKKNYQGTEARITVDGVRRLAGRMYHGSDNNDPANGSRVIKENSVIVIEVEAIRNHIHDRPSGVDGLYVRFKDTTRPVLNAYSFTGDGAERLNPTNNQMELYVKKNEFIDLTYRFSEVVRPTDATAGSDGYFLSHPIFVNPDGTNLPAEGQKQSMVNQTYTASNLSKLSNQISYKYTGVKYHNSGNLPLEPKISGTSADGLAPIDFTMEEKLNRAQLADAAGNIAVINMSNKADNKSNSHLRNKAVNPFDYENGGYRVIVDAVAPKYTKSGNGIQPEILTDVVLNNKDRIEFTVQFTEEAVIKRGWDVNKTYLLFNNGMRAYYQSGSGTDAWTFAITLDEKLELNTPLLKVLELAHDNKQSDTEVVQDYAGNMLIQPANYFGEHIDSDPDDPSKFESALVNSKIDWAGLSIDNIPPIITYRFENGGASATTYKKNGKVTIDANDPNLEIPGLDPVFDSEPGANNMRPSKGIYRPSNLSGAASPAVGLVYYHWSQSEDNPIADKDDDHYAAIKRFSLSGEQPSKDLYGEDFAFFGLSVANNKTNLIAPPTRALTAENSGIWYLHTWTADMTWDSARELMQYEKMKTFVQRNPEQYEAWKNELTGDVSDQEREFHADTMAMAAVGQYDNLAVWSLDDFKQDDSNWSYAVTPLLLDNRAPNVALDSIQDDQTSEVKVSFTVADTHSGVAGASYQFVKEGQAVSNMWTTASLQDGKQTVSTLDHALEDGIYALHIKAADSAGNESITVLDRKVTVDSTSRVRAVFTPESNSNYTQSHDIQFYTSGLRPLNNQLRYAITGSSVRPTNANAYKVLTGSAYSDASVEELLGANTENVLHFTIPQDAAQNGLRYVHITVEPEDEERIYTYMKAYYFDNEAPTVSFSRAGSSYPRELQEVTATVVEPYSVNGLIKKYQWVKQDLPAPDADSTEWLELSENGTVAISSEALEEEELDAGFVLYVFAQDGAGNATIAASEPFQVSKPAEEAPPASGDAQVIYLYSNDEGSYTAVMKLNLNALDKTGYSYSLSSNNGLSWSRWQSYTNFVSIELSADELQQPQIQAKFQTAGKVAGKPFMIELDMDKLEDVEPVYALASLNTTRPVRPEVGVEIIVNPALGVSVKPSATNPAPPERDGQSNTFIVRENGYYSFDLIDVTDSKRKATLYIVVSNVDAIPPVGEIELLSSAPTNKNVSAKLHASENVRILNNDGRSIYTFTENGSYTFEFSDEAGNVSTATAHVNFIDKRAPEVRIVRSYRWGVGDDEVFGVMRDIQDHVLASSGVVLTLEKAHANAKEFFVVGGENSIVLRENGTASFVVSDLYGNTTVISEEVTNIVPIIQSPELISSVFIDQLGNPLDASRIVEINGKSYAKGRLQLTFTGQTIAGNPIFSGIRAVRDEDGQYTNRISDESGVYTYQHIAEINGTYAFALSDLLGNEGRFNFTVEGLDNTPPELTLAQSTAAIEQNKENFNYHVDLGGYTVSDNLSQAGRIKVTISGLDLSTIGRQRVTYTAADQVGNSTTAVQDVYVVERGGMKIFANSLLISESSSEAALFDTNQLTFNIQGYNLMMVGGEEKVNERGTYDLLYYPGLYREGQMKYIATKLTYEQLTKQDFTVTFPKKGWYTIVLRNQERERVYATFFISEDQQN